MQENNFEKKVRQKIDELKLKPSDEVWQKVASVIEKRKNNRWVFAIILLLLILIGSAIIVIWNQNLDRKMMTTISQKNKSINLDSNSEYKTARLTKQKDSLVNKTLTKNQTSIENPIKTNPVVNRADSIQKEEVAKSSEKIVTQGTSRNSSNNSGSTININDQLSHIKKITTDKTNLQINISGTNANVVESAEQAIDFSALNKTIAIVITPKVTPKKVNDQVIDFTADKTTAIKKYENDTSASPTKKGYKNDIPLKNQIPIKQKSKWKFGLSFSAGVAATQNGYLGVVGSQSRYNQDFLSAPSQSTGGSTIPAVAQYVPSKIKTGIGYVAGIFIQKNISAKTNLLLGLNYKTYSSTISIGKKVDSSNNFSLVNYYYNSGSGNNYKNRFHFIELPVSAHFRLGKQKNAPVYLNTGVSVSQLVGSNALQFDAASGVYYIENALFNKTLFSVSAGLLFSIPLRANNLFLIGPDVNFSLNKMANSGLYKNRHYSYFGIHLQKNFGKK